MTKHRSILAVVGVLAFAAVAACVQLGLTAGAETWIYGSIAPYISPPLTAIARSVTFLCNPPTAAVICLALLLFPRTRRTIAIPVSAAAAIAASLGSALKHVFVRERPDILRLVHETSYSFPSGHSITSAAVGAVLLLLIMRQIRSPRRRTLFAVLSVLFPLLVGVSRVYLGVHHAGDVLGGWALGVPVGVVVYAVWEALLPRLPMRSEK